MAEESSKTLGGMLPFGFQSMPGGKSNPMFDILYSMGYPSLVSGRSIYSDQFDNNLAAGKNPFTGFPSGMIPGGMTGSAAPSNVVSFVPESNPAATPAAPNRMRGGLMGLNYRMRG